MPRLTRITVFGGAGEIGGNQLLLEDPGGTVLLDFGKPLGAYSRFFTRFGAPPASRGLHDHLLMGLLPPLRGLYREDLLPPGWAPREAPGGWREPRVDAILLTHAHQDHCGNLPFVDPAIPVAMTAQTAMVLAHLQDWGHPSLEGEYRYVRRRVMRHGALMAAQARHEAERRLRSALIPPGEPWDAVAGTWSRPAGDKPWAGADPVRSDLAGGLRFRLWPVDHSMVGSAAFGVETEAGWVIYTGDLRRHGRDGALTDSFVAAAAALEPALLITEGTNASHEGPPSPSEFEVRERLLEAVRSTTGMVVVNTPARNTDRLLSLYEVARAAGRQLLITEREADFLRHLRPLRPDLPDPDGDPWLCVYYRPRATDDEWHRFWRRPGRRATCACGSDTYLRRHPEEYLISFGLSDMVELVGVEVRPGGRLIYSNHRPYSPEQEADLERLLAWAEFLSLDVVGVAEPGFHASGHMGSSDLTAMVQAIGARAVMPVHTLTPEFFQADRLLVPTPGHPIAI